MKKLAVFFIVLVIGIIGVAVWFSPLAGRATVYDDNRPTKDADGFCYASGSTVRYDFTGSESDMYGELKRICARVVRVENADGVKIVYAYSDRVCSGSVYEDNEYNVMAAYRDGHVAIGAPVLEGSY